MKRVLIFLLSLCLLLGLMTACAQPQGEPAEPPGEEAGTQVPAVEPQPQAAEYTADATITFSANGPSFEGEGVNVDDDGEVDIKAGGVYRVTGASDSGRIVVDAAETDSVTLILDGCELAWADDEVIYFKTAGSAAVVLADGTENILTSGISLPEEPAEELAAEEGAAEEEDASGAALRAKTTLNISGGGSLAVYGYINNGIAATGDLTVTDGKISITSLNDALKSRGALTVSGGEITIDSQADAIQADGDITVAAGTLNVVTGGGSQAAEMKTSDSAMFGNGGPGGGMGPGQDRDRRGSDEAGENGREPSGEAGEAEAPEESAPEADTPEETAPEPAEDAGEAPQRDGASGEPRSEGERNGRGGASDENADNNFGRAPWDADDESSVSRKGLKTDGSILVTGGVLILDTADDAFHATVNVDISGGEISVASADDGVHADDAINISGGAVTVSYCYEGLEATAVTITDGTVYVTATDDGINVNGGDFGFPGFGGGSDEAEEETEEEETEKVTPVLRITGGTVIIDSGGDGLDSNGDLFIEGGVIRVNGPSTDWDAALDTGDGSNYTLLITGGELLAGGYSGMMEAPDLEESSQPSIYYKISDGYCADGDPVKLLDAEGNEILSYNLAHSFNCVVISSTQLTVGETYTLVMGDQSFEIVLDSTNYSNRMSRSGGSREMQASGEANEEAASEEAAASE